MNLLVAVRASCVALVLLFTATAGAQPRLPQGITRVTAVEGITDGGLITCLSMICPFKPGEKQALLEAPCCRSRAERFMTMLQMAVHEGGDCGGHH